MIDAVKVKASVELLAVVQRHVKLRRASRNWTGLCPFQPKDPRASPCTPKPIRGTASDVASAAT